MADVTAIILTKNEAMNIGDCLRSIERFAARKVVVDSGSTDDTVQIARSLGAEVVIHPFENYARQFNWGVAYADVKTQWILRLDADERFPEPLCRKLEEVLLRQDVDGVMLQADMYFMGRLLKHGGSKKRKVMLYRAQKGYVEDRRMDEHTVVNGSVIRVKERFEHHDFKDIHSYIEKLNWYATREMQDYFDRVGAGEQLGAEIQRMRKGKFGIYYRFPMFLRCRLLFIAKYIFCLGFLDGREGFIYYWMYHQWYRTLVDAKILEQMKFPKPFEPTKSLGE